MTQAQRARLLAGVLETHPQLAVLAGAAPVGWG
jgi:hypothetical protein